VHVHALRRESPERIAAIIVTLATNHAQTPDNRHVLRPYVAVIGASDATETELDLARTVGAMLARAGVIVVSGGLGGVMRASCEAAFNNGGTTVGLLPGEKRSDGNPFLSISVPTGLGQLRNGLVANVADAVIAIGGGWGTLSEIALAMRAGKPVVGLHTWAAQSPHPSDRSTALAGSAAEAVRLALSMIDAAP